MVRSTLCVHLPWGSLRPIFNFCNLGYRKLSWWWILGFVSSCCLLYVSNLRFAHSYKNQWSMLYKMLQTRILDSRYKIGANLQTELSKNDENDEKIKFFWYSQNQSGIIPASINWHPKQFFDDIFIPNHRIYEDLKIIRFYPKTPGNRDSGHQKSQVFHADACVRCCAGSRGFPLHGAKHSLCSLALGWPPAENRGSATLPPKINLSLIFQSCWR